MITEIKKLNPIGLLGVMLILIMGTGCRAAEATQTPEGGMSMSIQLTSPAFEEGGTIPQKYTCDGADVSPPLNWSGVPEETQSLALIMDDPDAPGRVWVHWVVYDLSPDLSGLEEDSFAGGVQGSNNFGKTSYGGPCPPGGPAHRYFFKLYALDVELGLDPGATKGQVEEAMQGHIIAQGQLMGRYSR